jgi:hypothetical protein
MLRPAGPFSVALAVAVLGPVWGCAPAARANFLATAITSRPSAAAMHPFQTFYQEPALEGACGAGDHSPLPANPLPGSLPQNKAPSLPGPSCLPFANGSSAGGAGGTSSGPGQGLGDGPPTAELPARPFLAGDEIIGFLVVQEAALRPPAFKSRLLRPPRKD